MAPVIQTYAVQGVQGSQAMSRAQNDADMQRALQRARETNALKAAMVAYAPTQRYYPVQEQIMASNFTATRPAPPATGGGLSAAIPVKVVKAPESEIPEFERPSSPGPIQAEPVMVSEGATELPSKRSNGLLGRLFKREKEDGEEMNSGGPAPGPADQPPAPSPVEAATIAATEGAVVAPPPQGIPEPPSFESTAPSPPGSGIAMPGGVNPPAPVEPVPVEPEPIAPIFQRRAGAPASGEMAAVKAESEAIVAGVLVRLYAGDKVSVLSRNGSEATIRLPDQRVGTVDASVLAP